MKITTARRLPTVAGLAFAMGWPLVLAIFIPKQNLHDVRQDVVILAAEWISLIVLYGIVVGWERRPFFATVGWLRPQPRDWIAVAFLACLAIVGCLIMMKHPTVAAHNGMLAQIVGLPFALRAAMVLTAGICEETLFRGYAVERLHSLTGNIWFAGAIATAFFTLGHIPRYGFTVGLLWVAVIAAMTTGVYIWRRNIAACVALHWLIDGFPLLIVPAFVTIR